LLQSQVLTTDDILTLADALFTRANHPYKFRTVKQKQHITIHEFILFEHHTTVEEPTGRNSEKHDGGDAEVPPEV